MTTRLRRKTNGHNGSLPVSSLRQTNVPNKLAVNKPRSSVTKYLFAAAAMLSLSCLGVELLSGRKLRPHAKAAFDSAISHRVMKRMGRKMNESLNRKVPLEYVNLATLDSNAPTAETFDVVVVGCGPSGLTAALFASRMGMSVLVLGSPSTGSLAGTETLDNFPGYTATLGGKGWLESTMDQAVGFGARFAPPTALATGLTKSGKEFEVGINIKKSLHDVTIRSRTVIVATGSFPRKLNLPHESELWGRSLHNCALCDGDAYGPRSSQSSDADSASSKDGKTVIVIGGGDAAVEAVSLLVRIGVKTIHWIHRSDEFKANAAEVERVKNLQNVQMWTSFVVVEWIVKESSNEGTKRLEGARIVGSKNGVADPGATSSLAIECDGAFLMIGSTPNTQWLKTSEMDIDEFGLIRLQSYKTHDGDNTPVLQSQTSIPGVFAAGEAVDGIYRQALTAASEGAKSAMDAERYLRLSETPIVPKIRERAAEYRHEEQTDNDESDDEQHLRIECDLTLSSCISEVVSEHPVVIFSKSFCSYCHRAKESMDTEGVIPFVIELDYMGRDGRRVQDTLEDMTGRRTVPNVFVGGKSIGGGQETVELHENGRLRKLLQTVNAL